MKLAICSYTDCGILTILVNERRYTYFHVPPFIKEKIAYIIEKGGRGGVMKMLRKYSRRDLFDMGRWRER